MTKNKINKTIYDALANAGDNRYTEVADFTTDLNAIYYALEILKLSSLNIERSYKSLLAKEYESYSNLNNLDCDGYFDAINAPAYVRAEALAIVIEKII
jgi:transposase